MKDISKNDFERRSIVKEKMKSSSLSNREHLTEIKCYSESKTQYHVAS